VPGLTTTLSIEVKNSSPLTQSLEIVAHDCINGSAFPRERIPRVSNFTSLQAFLLSEAYSNKLDPTDRALPFDTDIMLVPKVKLKINYHGCVDTLQEECTNWLEKHTKDGTNKTARARFPCFMMKNNTDFVVTT